MTGPEVVARAPGRVNLVGEHTDHQGGFVLPIAVAQGTTVRARARGDGVVRLTSDAVAGVAEIRPGDAPSAAGPAWARLPAAVLVLLRGEGLAATGFDGDVASDLPVGAGLSSSAALCVATALAAIEVARAAGADVPRRLCDRRALAALCRDAEALGAGVRCGIMDPFVSLHGVAGCAIRLDCRSLAASEVLIPEERVAFVVADSGVRHALADGAYGRRREECEEAARRLGVESLRDVDGGHVRAQRHVLGPVLLARARHVVEENLRVERAVESLDAGDVAAFGRILDDSHRSLRDDFEVSCPELDVLVEIARGVPGVLGSRMTGGGFGGSTVTAARPAAVGALLAAFEDEGRRLLGRAVPARRVVPAGPATVGVAP